MQTELMNLEKRTDYNTPQGSFNNTTVNLNDLRSTGIYRLSNCYIQNGPYKIGVNVNTNYTHWIYVNVAKFDDNTIYQTVYEGDNLYGRKLWKGNCPWRRYTNTAI